jgi:hypothetical protein
LELAIEILALPCNSLRQVASVERLQGIARRLARDSTQAKRQRHRALAIWCELTDGAPLALEEDLRSALKSHHRKRDARLCEGDAMIFYALNNAPYDETFFRTLLQAQLPELRVRALIRLHWGGAAVDLHGLTADSDARVRLTTYRLLGDAEAIREYAEDPHPCIQATALQGLSELAPDRALFERVLRGHRVIWTYYEPAREEAASALAALRDPQSLTVLLQVALTPQNDEVQAIVTRGLTGVTGGGVWRGLWLGLPSVSRLPPDRGRGSAWD